MKEEDRAPVKVVRIIALLLPLLLKLILVYLKYKKRVSRKEKYLRKELKKVGMEKHQVDEMCGDIQSMTLKDMLSMADSEGMLKGIFH
ncbi:MAG: hypothetical protein ACQEQM_05865 [Thermoplasmatota archaeon]